VRHDEQRALDGLRLLLPEAKQRKLALDLAHQLLAMGGPIKDEKLQRLERVAQILQVKGALRAVR